ncbi:MAG: amidohydrolase family protein [Candidatus Hermodarchaeia archaeon]|jgi:5-methylthioadenosine/S-adenosylhomocysteine deaminase
MGTLLVKNGLIITMDSERRIIEKGAVVIENDRIISVGKTKDVLKEYKPEFVIDAHNKVVIPGFVDTHSHLYQTLLKGLGDDLELIDWLQAIIFSTAGHFTQESYYYGTLLGCIELMKSGCTCVVDNAPLLIDEQLRDGLMSAFRDSGIRLIEAGMARDANIFGIIPEELIQDTKDATKSTVETIKKWHGKDNGRINVWFGVGTVFTTSEEFMANASNLAEKYGVGICIHLHESKHEVEEWKKRFGTTPIKYLHKKTNFLNSNVLAAHCVWVDDEDIQILRKTDTKVSHNPISNMFLASGIAPIPKLLRAGITVGLGDDGACVSGTSDMFEQMKTTVLLHKVAESDPTAITAETALEMATIKGARAIGLEKEIGSIEPGKRADLTIIDAKKSNFYPLNRVHSQLVYCGKAENVETVIVNGKIVMENRIVKTIDEQDVLENAQKAADELIDASNLDQLKKRV